MAKEGWSFVLSLLGVAAACLALGAFTGSPAVTGLGVGVSGLSAFTAFFFRDPERTFPSGHGAVVSAGDGRIVAVQRVEHPWVGEAVQISVFLSIFDVHVNRIPCPGTVDGADYVPGRFRLAFVDKASVDNEHTHIRIQGDGFRLAFKQVAGFIARRIVCRLGPGQTVIGGERFGLIRFGSRIDHFLPLGADVRVRPGDRVRAGETVIGVISK
jgi:phosphatidylserine decarboxylase